MITVTVIGDKALIDGLGKLAVEVPRAIERGLITSGQQIHRGAFLWLSGAGAKKSNVAGGAYPVPVRTGHLRRSLAWLKPGETKSNEMGSFSAGPLEVIIYNPAAYAQSIHDGLKSSQKYGPRPFLTDSVNEFLGKNGVEKAINDEIDKAKKKAGL